MKKWLQQILEILMAERGKEERTEQLTKLDGIIKKHEELIPTGSRYNFWFIYGQFSLHIIIRNFLHICSD